MAQTPFATRRSNLYAKIWQYEERKREVAKKYKIGTDEYLKAVRKINMSLGKWSREIKKMDTTSNKIVALTNAIAVFIGVSLNNKYKRAYLIYKNYDFAKEIYYKYGIEISKVAASDLRDFIGEKNYAAPAKHVMNINKKMKTDLFIKSKWSDFVMYIRERLTGSSDFIDKRKATG